MHELLDVEYIEDLKIGECINHAFKLKDELDAFENNINIYFCDIDYNISYAYVRSYSVPHYDEYGDIWYEEKPCIFMSFEGNNPKELVKKIEEESGLILHKLTADAVFDEDLNMNYGNFHAQFVFKEECDEEIPVKL